MFPLQSKPFCLFQKQSPSRDYSCQSEFVSRVKELHPDSEVLGDYINSRTKIKIKCKENHIFEIKAGSIQEGYWCNECGKNIKPHYKFVQELDILHPGSKVLEKYSGARTNILFQCEKAHKWKAKPYKILRGGWCSICANVKKKTHNEFVFEIAKLHPNGEVIDQYINTKTKIRFQCENNHIWSAKPTSILSGSWCPECWHIRRSKLLFTRQYSYNNFKNNSKLKTLPGILYLLEFNDNENIFHKIGITKLSIKKRWRNKFDYKIIKEWVLPIYDAFIIEQDIIEEYKINKYMPKLLENNGQSECFKLINISLIINEINKKIKQMYLYG